MLVIKRDGRKAQFDGNKIIHALWQAYHAVYGEQTSEDFSHLADTTVELVERKVNKKDITVEAIQDFLEQRLMGSRFKDVAKCFIKYREQRSRARERKSYLIQEISEKIKATNIENQNANMDERSFGGRAGEARSAVLKKYALDYCMSEKSRENHLNNIIYIHDLDSYAIGMHNCLTMPFDKLLAKGFNTRQTDVRPAQSVSTAFQLIAVLFQIQSLQQFGGVSASHIDWTMVPYVRKSFFKHYKDGLKWLENAEISNDFDPTNVSIEDEFYKHHEKVYEYALYKLHKETYQAVEGMYHNLNTLQSRSGNQLPFTSINYGTCTLPEGRLVTEAILDVLYEGIGKLKRTPIFPCGIFQSWSKVNRYPGTPNYDLYLKSLKATAKRLYPNYANIDWSGNKGFDENDPCTYFSTMGCRTANGFDINGMKQRKDGRGNICPVTIIMPTVAMMALEEAGDGASEDLIVNTFMVLLDEKISEAKDMLLERFDWIASQSPDSAKFMYENGTMEGYIPEEGIISALKHGTLSLGQIGLAETLQILIHCDHTTDKGMDLAIKIESLFKQRCAEFKELYHMNFGVYYTPAENLCYTAMKKFKEKYGIIPKVSENEYFTNSMHVPVWDEISPFDKIDIESKLTGYSSAGCITYVELDAAVKYNVKALEEIVTYAMEKDIPYFAVNVPNDMCLECGFTDYIENECPKCGSTNIQRLRRVTGYLTGNYKTAFNKGKQQETEMRVKHSNQMKGFEETNVQ